MSSLRAVSSEPQIPLWKERQDGLLEYCGPTDKPVVVDSWRKLDAEIDVDIWAQAAIAASVTAVYGQEDMQELADGVEKSVQYVRRMAKTFRYYTQKETRVSSSNIYFGHHAISLRHPEPRKALLTAAEKGWTCRRFEDWIVEQRGGKKKKEHLFTDLDRSERTEYLKGLRERVEKERRECRYKEYKGMLADLIESIDWDIYQLGFGIAEDRVREAIDQGQTTVKQIVRFTHLKDGEVHKVIGKLVTDGEYEWFKPPKTTKKARGTTTNTLRRVRDRQPTAHHDPNVGYNSLDEDGDDPDEHY
jgi:hypothetical protein